MGGSPFLLFFRRQNTGLPLCQNLQIIFTFNIDVPLIFYFFLDQLTFQNKCNSVNKFPGLHISKPTIHLFFFFWNLYKIIICLDGFSWSTCPTEENLNLNLTPFGSVRDLDSCALGGCRPCRLNCRFRAEVKSFRTFTKHFLRSSESFVSGCGVCGGRRRRTVEVCRLE